MGMDLGRFGMTDRRKPARLRAQVLTKEYGMKETTGRELRRKHSGFPSTLAPRA